MSGWSTYWRQLRQRAISWPEDKLAWAESVVGAAFFLGVLWLGLGRERAMEELISTALYVSAAIVCAGVFLLLRLGRAAYEMHVEALRRISIIERERDEALALLATKDAAPAERRRRGVAELLELEPEASDEIWRRAPEINAVLEEFAVPLTEGHRKLQQIASSTSDNRLLRKRNRAVYDELAQRFSPLLYKLKHKVAALRKPVNDLSDVYAGYVDWAAGPRIGAVSLDSLKDGCRKTVAICDAQTKQLEGVIDSARRSLGGQTGPLDTALEEYESILTEWINALANLRASAQRVVDFE
jgi:hypothetical protein